MRMIAIHAQTERKRLDRSVRCAEKRRPWARKQRLRGLIRPDPAVCATAGAACGRKSLSSARIQAIFTSNDTPLGECRLKRVFHMGDGRWWDAERRYWRNGQGRRVRRPTNDILHAGKWTSVVLACAHLHHDPSDSRFEKLAALCQRCHMIHDAPEHRRRRWMNAHFRRALGDLFYGPYPEHGADWITPTPASMLDDPRLLYFQV